MNYNRLFKFIVSLIIYFFIWASAWRLADLVIDYVINEYTNKDNKQRFIINLIILIGMSISFYKLHGSLILEQVAPGF